MTVADLSGLDFVPIGIEHRARVAELLARHPQPLSDYCVASLLTWATVFDYRIAFAGPETLLVSAQSGIDGRPSLLQPVGVFPAALQQALLEQARESPESLRFESVSDAFLRAYPEFVERFDVVPVRDGANYVYAASDLAELPGRRYAKKRNLIAQASRLASWTAEPLGPEQAQSCLDVDDDIAVRRASSFAVTLPQETRALGRALDLLRPLSLRGLLLRANGRPAAFSIFDRLNPTTAVVLFERALRSETGLYQVINREAARVIAAEGFAWINREEDLGDPGLRQAKLSYFPARLEMKYTLTLRA